MNSLQAELDKNREKKGGYQSHDYLQIELAQNNKVDTPIPKVGQKAIPFSLPNDNGKEILLDDLLQKGPVILNFFRGNFCEYCQLELKALQRSLKEFQRYQASLVGVSPSTITIQTVSKDSLELSYSLLSDAGNKVASLYGLSYKISDELGSVFEGFGIEMNENLGLEEKHEPSLSIPATFVVNPNQEIVFAFADSDHTKRAEPSDIIASLMSIV